MLLNIGSTLADRLSQNSRKPPDFATEGLVRVGDLLSTYRPNPVRGGAVREDAISACLGIIESIALPIAKAQKGELSVNLIVYVGKSKARMKVRRRNPGNLRPANREFEAEHVLGHYVCQHGESPMVVNHIGHFGSDFAKSPTQTSYSYKAILIIPMLCDTDNGRQARGFVSIDCDRPYAFYGNRANEIAVMCKPIVGQLREMV